MLRQLPRQFYLAVTDFDFYLSIFQQPLRRTWAFLLFVAVTVATVGTAIEAWRIFPELDQFSRWGEQHLPAFSVEGGKLHLKQSGPVILRYETEPPWTLLLSDTPLSDDQYPWDEPSIWLLPEEVVFRYRGSVERYLWADIGDFEFEPSRLPTYLPAAKLLFLPIAYSFLLVFNVLAKLFAAFLLTPLALWSSMFRGVRLPYSWGFTIAAYSLAPAVTIDLGVRMTGVQIAYFDWIYIAIAAVYVVFATKRCVTPA